MSQSGLLKSKRFFPLFLTQFLGALNDNFLKNALVILVTYKTTTVLGFPAEQMVAWCGGIFILPFFLFSAQSGQIADKFEKTRIIRWVKTAEIGIMLLAMVGFVTMRFDCLLFSLFLMGCHSTLFGPIKFSILPQLLNSQEIVGGNALVEAGTFLAILLGTIGGGVLILREPYGGVWVSGALVLIAGLGLVASFAIPAAPAQDPLLKINWNPFTPTWNVIQDTRKTKSVFLSILGVSWFWFFGAMLLSMFPLYCKIFLKAHETVFTFIFALFSVGIGLGSLLCERLSRKHLELGLVPLGSIGMSLFTLDLFLVGTPGFLAGQAEGTVSVAMMIHQSAGLRIFSDLFLMAVFAGFYIVPLNTLIQTRSDPKRRSRIIAGNNIINALFMVAASVFLVGMLHFNLAPPEIFLTLSLMNAAVAIYIYSLLPEFFLRFLAWMIANVMYRLKVVGDENIPNQGPGVIVCNHVSFVDWLIISAGVKRPIRFIMDHSFAKGFLMIQLMKQAKVIPIATARENPELLKAAFDRAADELKAGELVGIFPEGKITYDGKLNPFKPGIERMVTETPVPVIPMALTNLWGSFFSREGGKALVKRPKRFWSRIELRIGEPVSASEVNATVLYERVEKLLREKTNQDRF